MTLQMVPLASAIHAAKPGFASGDDLDEGVFQIRMNNITRDGGLDLTKKRRVRLDGKKADGLLAEVGDVLFNATNSPDLVGKSAYIGSLSEPTTFSNHFIRLRTKPEKLDGNYLARWLHTQFQSGRFKALCRQWVNQATVSRDALLGLEIPLPSLPEQRRIAAILDQADALRAKRREALAQLDSLTQSIFMEMFGDPVSNTKGWPTFALSKVCSISGEYGAGLSSKEFDPSLPRYVRITDIKEGGDLNDEPVSPSGVPTDWAGYELKVGDILFARSGATVGKTYQYKESDGACVFAGYLIRFRPELTKVRPSYLFYFTQTGAYRSWVAARQRVVAQPNINAKQYGDDLVLPVPPVGLQKEFEHRLENLDGQKLLIKNAQKEHDELFTSLQYRAFRGEL